MEVRQEPGRDGRCPGRAQKCHPLSRLRAFWLSPLRLVQEPLRACSLQADRGKTSRLHPSPLPERPQINKGEKPLGPSVFPAGERWPSGALLEAASSQGLWGNCSAPAGGSAPAPALPPGGAAQPAGATPHHAPAQSLALPPPRRGHPSLPAGWQAGPAGWGPSAARIPAPGT